MKNRIEQTVTFIAAPHEVYETIMDSDRHSTFTNSEVIMSRVVGGEYSAYDGYITGKNVELVPDKKIVQTWKAVDWEEGQYSIITFILTPIPTGTQLQFIHEKLPDGTEEEFTQGWIDNYWEPMKQYFENK
ncbi:MAG: SRPBCC family protein [Chloroflexota bacterium]